MSLMIYRPQREGRSEQAAAEERPQREGRPPHFLLQTNQVSFIFMIIFFIFPN